MPAIEINKLKPYPLNKEFFDSLPRDDYSALKLDIERRGIKTELQVTPEFLVLSGHQRLKIAKELCFETVPCKVIHGLKTDNEIKEYVIKDNLLRRHLDTSHRYLLYAALSKIYEGPKFHGNQWSDAKVASDQQDVNVRTAKETGATIRTIARAREYSRIIEKKPELKGKKVTDVLRQIKKEKQLKALKEEKIEKPNGLFNVIVCDPPWPGTGVYDSNGLRGAGDYPTMTISQIKNVKLPAEKDCILWLWAIDYNLKDALEVIEAWNFERKSTLIWIKDKIGLGHWLRNQHEYCFLCVKGKPVFHGERTPSILNAPRRKHSEKPEEFYSLIEKTSPYKRKLDYFARKKRNGWECYGDEI